MESNLDETASAKALGDAIEELGRSFGGGGEADARAAVTGLRAQGARAQDFAQAFIEMIAALCANALAAGMRFGNTPSAESCASLP